MTQPVRSLHRPYKSSTLSEGCMLSQRIMSDLEVLPVLDEDILQIILFVLLWGVYF